jgi:orotate phosphoribosyltransferase
MELFRARGAYLQGHFRLTSGLHSSSYLQCALVLQYPDDAERLGHLLAEELRRISAELGIDSRSGIGVVASPALGGVIVGHEVARALGSRFVFTERDPADRKMRLRRGFHIAPSEVAVVVEDVITTGGSTLEVVDTLRAAGAQVVAAGSIIDRSGGKAEVGVPRVALATLQVESHQPDVCPLCAQGIPVIKPGSRPA